MKETMKEWRNVEKEKSGLALMNPSKDLPQPQEHDAVVAEEDPTGHSSSSTRGLPFRYGCVSSKQKLL